MSNALRKSYAWGTSLVTSALLSRQDFKGVERIIATGVKFVVYLGHLVARLLRFATAICTRLTPFGNIHV